MWAMTAMRWHSPQIGHCLRTLVTHWSDVTLRWDLLNIDPEYPLRLHSFMEIVPYNPSIKHISPMLTQSLKMLSRQKSPEVPCRLPKDSRKGCLFLKISLQFSKMYKKWGLAGARAKGSRNHLLGKDLPAINGMREAQKISPELQQME